MVEDLSSKILEPTISSGSNSFASAIASRLKAAVNEVAISRLGLLDEDGRPLTGSVRILLALSGGADSSSLLSALAKTRDTYGFSISACHVNHHLRGEESDADEAYCKELCSKLEVPFEVQKDECSSDDPKSEAALRERRYALLITTARQRHAHFIVTAHTLDDQVETVLFRLVRGTALSGVTGMLPVRQLDTDVFLIRPMLLATRRDCNAYLLTEGIRPRHDSSNDDPKFARNFIRGTIIPALETKFPGFRHRLENFRTVAESEDEFLTEMARQKHATLFSHQSPYRWSLTRFFGLPLPIKRRVVSLGLQERNIELSFERIEAILALSSKKPRPGRGYTTLSLNEQWDVRIENDALVWIDKDEKRYLRTQVNDTQLKLPGLTLIPVLGRALRIENLSGELLPDKSFSYPKAYSLEALMDLSDVRLPLVLRSRKPGDFIQPLGMEKKVKLKKFLHTHKNIAAEFPAQPTVVIADQEEVLWVPGVGLSERVRVRKSPTHKLYWLPLSKDDLPIA